MEEVLYKTDRVEYNYSLIKKERSESITKLLERAKCLYKNSEYSESLDIYLEYLKAILNIPECFTDFARAIPKISQYYKIGNSFFENLYTITTTNDCADIIKSGCLKIISDYWNPSEDTEKFISSINKNYSVDRIDIVNKTVKSKCEKIYIFSRINVKNCVKKNDSTNKRILRLLESVQLYEKAFKWARCIYKYSGGDPVCVRSMLRICRLRNDYSEMQDYFFSHPDPEKTTNFNIQYEMVLYYDSVGDEEKRNKVLEMIGKNNPDNIPICNTLFKFYIRFEMLSQAREIEKKISKLNSKKGKVKNQKELKAIKKEEEEKQNAIWEKLGTLVNEQAHNRQMLAVTELIKGFSHELGQPITNIRYSIQLYYMEKELNGIKVDPEVKALLDSAIKQTARVGKLLDRFAPIVSSKNIKEKFIVFDEITCIFSDLENRLKGEQIAYHISGDKKACVIGEKLQFSQIFNNLIFNSIYAIKKKDVSGLIKVDISCENNKILIRFEDNGTGIPKENHIKIFEPFFSTKKKEYEEGGEGLGLYIVWNLLKSINGKIKVDPEYSDGAAFLIEINTEVNNNE